jgi:LacI family transcriptional regulator
MALRAGVKDVARHAGVSVGTVSNVLNRPEAVAATTRERVEAAMAELGFVRNASARQLRAGRSQTVGAILMDLSNPFYTELARGIEDRLALDDHTLMLCSSDEDEDREARYLRLFAEQGVRGILVTPFSTTKDRLKQLARLGIPAVLIDARSSRISSVGVDNVAGATAAVTHLLDQGHRRIGFVNGPLAIQQCHDRAIGAAAAVRDAGLAPGEVLVQRTVDPMTADQGQAAARAMLDEAPDVTAIFCVNDIVALGVMRELRLRGLHIPHDVAVVGYDDIHFAAELMTPLTSVRQPMHQLGWTAVDLLMRDSAEVQHVQFTPELIVRQSSSHRRNA